ncbi:hypothetical protein F4778DRAFT_343223 [Xylariomycetidae sp. FL2044]|nr:hypothetical protein F4778DRAFT_343223 [Xylariomycetidae sp. FL2044]
MSESRILAIFGATGQQGSSVLNYVLKDPELSGNYKIRALTRDTNAEKARQLGDKVEVVQADMNDRASLDRALGGVHTAFVMTTPSMSPNALQDEYDTGKRIADAAVAQGVTHLIFSTLPSVRDISGGKYTKVAPFDAKAAIEAYIRGLSIQSTFYCPAFFMENFAGQPFLAPRKDPNAEDVWVLERPNKPETRLPYIDAVGDTGKFIGAVLATPERFIGKTIVAAQRFYTYLEIVDILSRTTGKTVVYRQVSAEEFKKALPFFGEMFDDAFGCLEEFGYFGPGAEEKAAWAADNVGGGRLTSLEEYLVSHPLQL